MAKNISRNMEPPPTYRASVSFSSWRAVPDEETRLCQPEMAPQAMVTNRIGHNGPSPGTLKVRECREISHSGVPDKQADDTRQDSQRDDPEGDVVDGLRPAPDG